MNRRGFFSILPAGLLVFLPWEVKAAAPALPTRDYVPLTFMGLQEFVAGKDLQGMVMMVNKTLYIHYQQLCLDERIRVNAYHLSSKWQGVGYCGVPMIYRHTFNLAGYNSHTIHATYKGEPITYEMALVPMSDLV